MLTASRRGLTGLLPGSIPTSRAGNDRWLGAAIPHGVLFQHHTVVSLSRFVDRSTLINLERCARRPDWEDSREGEERCLHSQGARLLITGASSGIGEVSRAGVSTPVREWRWLLGSRTGSRTGPLDGPRFPARTSGDHPDVTVRQTLAHAPGRRRRFRARHRVNHAGAGWGGYGVGRGRQCGISPPAREILRQIWRSISSLRRMIARPIPLLSAAVSPPSSTSSMCGRRGVHALGRNTPPAVACVVDRGPSRREGAFEHRRVSTARPLLARSQRPPVHKTRPDEDRFRQASRPSRSTPASWRSVRKNRDRKRSSAGKRAESSA